MCRPERFCRLPGWGEHALAPTVRCFLNPQLTDSTGPSPGRPSILGVSECRTQGHWRRGGCRAQPGRRPVGRAVSVRTHHRPLQGGPAPSRPPSVPSSAGHACVAVSCRWHVINPVLLGETFRTRPSSLPSPSGTGSARCQVAARLLPVWLVFGQSTRTGPLIAPDLVFVMVKCFPLWRRPTCLLSANGDGGPQTAGPRVSATVTAPQAPEAGVGWRASHSVRHGRGERALWGPFH